MLVEPGKLSLVGGTVVDGPLAQSTELYPGLAYEVTVGSRRVAVGQVQDAGVLRSFGDPSGRPASPAITSPSSRGIRSPCVCR